MNMNPGQFPTYKSLSPVLRTQTTCNSLTVQNNSIYNNGTYNLENRTGKAIAAKNNYWGTVDAGATFLSIDDYYDNINYGEVTYSPFLPSANANILGPKNPFVTITGQKGTVKNPVFSLSLGADGSPPEMIIDQNPDFPPSANWEPFAATKEFKADGTKYIYAKYRDASANESAIAFARPKGVLYIQKNKTLVSRPVNIKIRVAEVYTKKYPDLIAKLYFRGIGETAFQQAIMDLVDNVHQAWIPAESTANGIEYYIVVEDGQGNVVTSLPESNPSTQPMSMSADQLVTEFLEGGKDVELELAMGVTVKLPASAVASDTNLVVKKPLSVLTPPPGITPTGIGFDVSLENGRDTFIEPVQLAIGYNHKEISEVSQRRLRVYYRRDDGLIRLVQGFVDLLTKEFKFSTHHFSSFFLAESLSVYPDPVTTATPGQPLTIQVSILNDVPLTQATLFYKKVGTESWQSLVMSKVGDYLEATIPGSDVVQAGLSYYIVGSDGETSTTSDPVDVFTAPDKYEADDTAQQANVIMLNDQNPDTAISGYEKEQAHNFHQAGDEDWGQFYGIQGKVYKIQVKNPGAQVDARIELFGTDGTTKLQDVDDMLIGEAEYMEWLCPADGVYFVRIRQALGSEDKFGPGTNYALTLSIPEAVFNGFITGQMTPVVSLAKVSTGYGSALTLPNGYYFMPHIAGSFTLTVNVPGYLPYSSPVTVGELQLVTLNITLSSNTPPAAPTLAPVSSPTRTATQTIHGTKEANTSVWLNAIQIVAADQLTVWSYTMTLNEGNNLMSLTAKNASGLVSTAVTGAILLDTQVPVVSAGSSQTKGAIFTQIGSATDTNATTYVWSKQSGPGTITFGSPGGLSTTIAASADGSYTIRFTATDAAGNISYSDMTLVWDTSKPTVSIGNPSATLTKSDPVMFTVTYTGADSITLAAANVTLNKTGTAIGAATVAGTGNTRTVTVSGITGDGTLGIAIAADTARDNAGNSADASLASGTFVVDNTAPVTTASPVDGLYGSAQNVTLATNEEAVIYYTTDGSDPTTSSTVYSNPLQMAATTTLKYFAKDLAGNMEQVKTQSYTIDTSGPSGSITIDGGVTVTNSTDLSLSLSAVDAAGITQMQFSNDGISWSAAEEFAGTKNWTVPAGDGPKTIYVKFKDGVGNWSNAYTVSVTLDTTVPVTTASPVSGTYGSAQSVTLTANEAATIYYTTNGADPSVSSSVYSAAIPIATTTTLKYFAKDAAGNAEAIRTQTYTVDTAGPVGTVGIDGGLGRTNNTAIILNLSAADGAGVTQMQFSTDGANWSVVESYEATKTWTLPAGDGPKTIYVKFKDGVGNWSNIYTTTIALDTTAPVTMASPVGGTYGSAQSVTLSANEAATIYYTTDGNEPTTSSSIFSAAVPIATTTTMKYFAKDAAGNAESTKSQAYTIDTSGPSGSVAINGDITRINGTEISLNLSAADTIGVTQMQFSNDGINWSVAEAFALTKSWTLPSGDGLKTIYVKFKDGVGNWSNAYTATITLDTAAPVTTASPVGGNYGAIQTVTLTADEVATIYYTTDGSEPTVSSNIYSAAIAITSTRTIKYFAKDAAGNVEGLKSQTYVIDMVGPIGTIGISGGLVRTNNTSITLNLTATDGVGITEMTFSNDGLSWSAAESYAATKSWTLPMGDGPKTIYVKFKDGVGNWSNAYSVTVVLDTTAPVTTASPVGGTYGAAQTVILAADETAIIYYTTDGSEPTISSSVYSAAISIPTTRALKYFAKDVSGNMETVKSQTYTIDTTGPLGAVSVSGGLVQTNNTAITLNLSVADGAGITLMQFSTDGTNWFEAESYAATKYWTLTAGDGPKTIYVKFKDGVGNWSNAYTTTVTLDTTAPVTTASPVGGTYGSAQSVTLSANEAATIYYTTDGNEPTTSSSILSAAIPVPTTTTLKYFAKDTAGNVEAAKSQNYTIDTAGPDGTVSISGEMARTNNTLITLKLSATDGAGVTQISFSNDGVSWSAAESYAGTKSWTLPMGDGLKTIYVKFKDGVGNWSNAYTATITLDTAAPVTTASPVGGNYGAIQTVTLTADEVATIYYTTDGSEPTVSSNIYSTAIAITSTKTIKYFAKDAAGNGEAIRTQTFTIDTAGPTGTIGISGGLVRTNNTSITLNLTATDGAGITEMTFSNDDLRWSAAESYAATKSWTLPMGDGPKTIYVKFKDGVGNWSNAYTTTVTLDKTAPVTTAGPVGGTYGSAQSVTLTANETATIYFTLNGSEPTETSSVYSGAIPIAAATTLKYFAKDLAGNIEQVKTQSYTIDTSRPSGSITINGGMTVTNNAGLTLSLSAADAAGVTQMQFSNDGIIWSAVEDYSSTKPWTLPGGDGVKTIYVKYKDGAGNWSDAYRASVILDTTAPMTLASPAAGLYATAQNVTLVANEEATIYYTTDGSNPSDTSTTYSGSILISADTTFKYFAKDTAGNMEQVITESYIINPVLYGVTGDMNGDGDVTLADAIIALQVMANGQSQGLRSDYVTSHADVNSDQRVGSAEALYIIQRVAGLR